MDTSVVDLLNAALDTQLECLYDGSFSDWTFTGADANGDNYRVRFTNTGVKEDDEAEVTFASAYRPLEGESLGVPWVRDLRAAIWNWETITAVVSHLNDAAPDSYDEGEDGIHTFFDLEILPNNVYVVTYTNDALGGEHNTIEFVSEHYPLLANGRVCPNWEEDFVGQMVGEY